MSYYEGRSSILGGSPEPGLSSVIKVSLEFSRVFWKNNLCSNDWSCALLQYTSQVQTDIRYHHGVIWP